MLKAIVCGVPLAMSSKPMRGLEDIQKGIAGFVKYWDNLNNADVTGECRRRYEHVMQYWQRVLSTLQEPLSSATILKDNFWPTTRVQASLAHELGEDGEDLEEFGEDEAYVGPLSGRPDPSFRVGRDLFDGYFVAVRPTNGATQPVWIARALSNPNCNPEEPNCVLIQYFRPTSRDQDVRDFYTGWDSERGLRWKVAISDQPVWEDTNTLITAWKSQIRKDTRQCLLKIPAAQIDIIYRSLASYV